MAVEKLMTRVVEAEIMKMTFELNQTDEVSGCFLWAGWTRLFQIHSAIKSSKVQSKFYSYLNIFYLFM